MAEIVTFLIGVLIGLFSGFILGGTVADDYRKENTTHNQHLYDRNISIDTKEFKIWVIEHEAKLAKENIND